MKHQVLCSTQKWASVPVRFSQPFWEGCLVGHMTPFLPFAGTSSLSLLGPQADFMKRAKCLSPVLLCPWGFMLSWPDLGPIAFPWLRYLRLIPPSFPSCPWPPLPTWSLELPDFSAWQDSCDCFWPCQLPGVVVAGDSKGLQTMFSTTSLPCTYTNLFINRNPLPLVMLPTYFYVDNMFCHFGKCKQINMPSFLSSLVISRKGQEERKRKGTQDWA